jgi:hypothetical protein
MTAFAICFLCTRENRTDAPVPGNWVCQHCGASLAACGQRLDRRVCASVEEGGGRALAGLPVPGYSAVTTATECRQEATPFRITPSQRRTA